MRFEDFARSHGLILNGLTPGKWVATPTEDHPRSRNGRYKFMGDHGFVQNWATMTAPAVWKGQASLTYEQVKQTKMQADKERKISADKAAAKAGWILHQTRPAFHPYLKSKGFPEEEGNVWVTDDGLVLVIPMRLTNGKLVGVQLINEKGEKKFLNGQITKGAVFCMDAKGVPLFVEGYATALSVRAAMKSIKIRYTIYVCFSAGNMEFIAKSIPGGLIIADHDGNGTGENAAKKTGKPYWLSPTVGDDMNDMHLRDGLYRVGQSLKKVLIENGLIKA